MNNNNINRYLFSSILSIVAFSTITVSIIIYSVFVFTSYKNLKADTNISLTNGKTQIEKSIENIDILTEEIQFYSKSNYDLMSDLKKYRSYKFNNNNFYQSSTEIREIFKTLLYRKDNINFMALCLPNGKIISYSNTNIDFHYLYNHLQSNWYNDTLNLKGKLNLTLIPNKHSMILNSGSKKTILFSKAIYDFYDKKLLGVIVINTNPNIFYISSIANNKISNYSLIDPESKQILYKKSNTFLKQTIKKRIYIPLSKKKLLLTLSINISEYINVLIFTLVILTVILLIIFIITFLITKRFTNKFTIPIIDLSMNMSKAHPKLDNDFNFKLKNYPNEIQMLYQSFNQLLITIAKYTKEKIAYEQSLLKSQLNIYKNQINSHFLYNTLESINSFAEVYEIDDISTMIISLSNMFRYASNGFINEASIKDELINVSEYLAIQDIRFQKKFDYLCIIDDELLSLRIPKLILQPLIENAVYHGLDKGGYNGKIRIFINKDIKNIYIRVIDTGKGISDNKINAIREDLKNAISVIRSKEHHIGLINIHARIVMNYGNNYGVKIYSREGIGTIIQICIPINKNSKE